MKRTTRIWTVIAAVLVAVGLITFAAVMSANGWDFTALNTRDYVTNTHEIGGAVSRISMDTDTADIVFAPSDNGKCRVVCYEESDRRHTVAAENGTLTVRAGEREAWYSYIGVGFTSARITVYLPQEEYASLSLHGETGNVTVPEQFAFGTADITLSTGSVRFDASVSGTVRIQTSTGGIHVEGMRAGDLVLSATTGRITLYGVDCDGTVTLRTTTGRTDLTDVRCNRLTSGGSTGTAVLQNVVAEASISVERSTGDVKLDRCDAGELSVKTSTGSVTGSLLTEKVFVTHTDTGRVDLPATAVGGKCEITTTTGDIRIRIN